MLLILMFSLIIGTVSNASEQTPAKKAAFDAFADAEHAYKIRVFGTEKNKEIYPSKRQLTHEELLANVMQEFQKCITEKSPQHATST